MSARAASLVIGTAGHIDHGKTSLVRALTGVDLDASPEEKERGITIDLGFTPLDLPDGRRAALVDVPGHERLVRTMIAGATGIDAVLLCVSAVDGVMPQTREHLAILGLLGVVSGLVVLTMADLVDAELLELAREDVADATRGTFLQGVPILPFAAPTGEGADALLAAMATLTARARRLDGPFRLPVDRTFVRPGFGTVASGTVWSGRLADGAQVRLLPDDTPARVRGLQVHGEAASEARAGERVALNLAGVERAAVPRGTVVVAGSVACSQILDVRYHHLPGAPPLVDGDPVRVLHGTTERLGRVRLAAPRDRVEPGQSAWAQLRLDAPLPCLPGDRFVVRRPSPVETLGGGELVDPWAPKLRSRDRDACARQLERLHRGDTSVWLERAGEAGLSPQEWAERGSGGVILGDRVFAATVVARLEGALLEGLARYHAASPLTLGANRRELRRERLAHLSERVFDALVDGLAEKGLLRIQGPLLSARGFTVRLEPDQRALQARIRATIDASGLAGVAVKELHERHPEPEVAALVFLLEAEGVVVQVPGIGWASKAALDGLQRALRAWFAAHRELSPGAFKDLTELSRKSAIPLLEWLDRGRVTRREGDVRLAGERL